MDQRTKLKPHHKLLIGIFLLAVLLLFAYRYWVIFWVSYYFDVYF